MLTFQDYIEKINFIDFLVQYEGYQINIKESKLNTLGYYQYAELIHNNTERKLILLIPSKGGQKNYYIFLDRETQESGHIIKYLQLQNLTPSEINQKLTPIIGAFHNDKQIYVTPKKSEKLKVQWNKYLKSKLKKDNPYMLLRGFSKKTLSSYKNIYQMDNSVIFPLFNLQGTITGLESKSFKTVINPSGNHCFEHTDKVNSFMITKNYQSPLPKNIIICEHLINGLSYAQMNLNDQPNLIFATAGQFSDEKAKNLVSFIKSNYSNHNLILAFDNDLTGLYFSAQFFQSLHDSSINNLVKKKNSIEFNLQSEHNSSPVKVNSLSDFISFYHSIVIPSDNLKIVTSALNDFNKDLMIQTNKSENLLINTTKTIYDKRCFFLQKKIEQSSNPKQINYYSKLLDELPELQEKLIKKQTTKSL